MIPIQKLWIVIEFFNLQLTESRNIVWFIDECVSFRCIAADNRENLLPETSNDSVYAIISMVPSDLHKFLTSKTRNQTLISNNNSN